MKHSRLEALKRIDDICEQFELLLKQKKDVDIAEWTNLVDEDDRSELFLELLRLETHHRACDPYNHTIGEYFRKFPEYSNEIVKVFTSKRSSETWEPIQSTLPPANVLSSGDKVDRFEIISLLGAGGFSAVYLARDPERSQAVALKVLNAQSEQINTRNFECIVNEANVLSRIDHPATPKVFDVGEAEDGSPWVSMEFIKGESLYKLLATDELSLLQILNILVKTARALHEVHEAGFSHRDIKPDNIIIGLDGEPRILDFGLALHENLQRDKSGERAGTTAFMSPEQAQGQSEDLDGRTDIWALGVILYLVVAKRLPFQGKTKEEIRREIIKRPAKPPRQIKNNLATIEIENVCLRALRKEPQKRHSTAKDFADELQLAIDALPAEFLLQDASRTRSLTRSEQCQIELARKARIWTTEPTKENLPGPIQYLRFRSQCDRELWTDSESALMSAAVRHMRNVALALAAVAVVLVSAFAFLQKLEREAKVQRLITEIGITPVSDVMAKFRQESTFAPEECLEAVRDACIETSSDESTAAQHLRYAIILSPDHPEFRDTFKKSLIDATSDEIETLSNLAFADQDDSIPTLDDHWRQRLPSIVSNTSFVEGIEHIWRAPPKNAAEQFRSLGGTLTERYAICTDLTIDQFKTVASEFRAYCYRPVCVRPWTNTENEHKVAAIWHRSSADWKISWFMSPLDFMEVNSKESMHLVDIADGLQLPGKKPKLVALWSNRESPYGKARQMLLANRIEQLTDPRWREDRDSSTGLINKDFGATYLQNAPLLADVCLHSEIQFKPNLRLENQKLSVAELILQSCRSLETNIEGTSDLHRLEIGTKMKAEAFYALERFEDSSEQFQRKTDEGDWPELRTRALSFAKSGNIVSANHSMTLLKQRLTEACSFKAKPYVRFGVARAIAESVRAEINFWNDKDTNKFIRRTRDRIRRIENVENKRKYAPWAEYYSMAISTRSVAKAIAINSDDNATRNSKILESLNKYLTSKYVELKPKKTGTFLSQTDQSEIANDSRLTNAFLPKKQLAVRSSAWSAKLANYESKFVEPRNSRSHELAAQRLNREGYFPATIVFGSRSGGTPKTGSIWQKELLTAELERREQRLANTFCFGLKHNENVGIWAVLGSANHSSLKQRTIHSIFKFKINMTILLDRLDESSNPEERLAILAAIRPYTTWHINPQHRSRLLSTLSRILDIGTPKECELAKILEINLTPIQTANTTHQDRVR